MQSVILVRLKQTTDIGGSAVKGNAYLFRKRCSIRAINEHCCLVLGLGLGFRQSLLDVMLQVAPELGAGFTRLKKRRSNLAR